jgi:RNA polymerase sigma-70 factor (ECF subfamily)
MDPSLEMSVDSAALTPDEEAAMIAAAQRDPEIIAQIYQRFSKPVYRYFFSRAGNRADAEDLTAQVFYEVLQSLNRYRAGGSFAAWLFTIARRRAVDHFRRRRPDVSLTEQIQSGGAGTDPLAETVRHEESHRLRELVGALDEADRELLRLRFAADLRLAEIARLLWRSEGAVKMSLHRLLQRLEHDWEGDHE